ncbi:hypothetical protein H6F46_11830 [Limnothrix sp. FACHB-1083]|uniref:hypothetical protein n=1 Tax=unclassified Limnothrix TaxID=2632864 RepID=UPI001681AD1F|nr:MULTISPECIES: hypothetical protein [unclassified Limnothrix]MBD2161379.1 hypothetical protein [Limnothrix sp. FACHB-1083]MBD2192109.1 hypothetical protein [Limnothrix sp. FACHB-1088]
MTTLAIPKITPLEFSGGKGQPYLTPMGALPSVTTILRETASEETRMKLAKWAKSKRSGIDPAERGTMVHSAIEALLKGEPAQLPQSLWGFYESVLPILKGITHVASEICCYHPDGYAGRADCLALVDGELTLLDWKTTTKPFLHGSVDEYLDEIQNWDNRIAEARQQERDHVLSAAAAARLIRKIQGHRSRVTSDLERRTDYLMQLAAYARALEHTYGLAIDRAQIVLILPDQPAMVVMMKHGSIRLMFEQFRERLDSYAIQALRKGGDSHE